MCFSSFLNLIIFPVYFLKRKRKKGVVLSRWDGERDMGGVGREENLIRMYCIVLHSFSVKCMKKELFFQIYNRKSFT